MMFKSNSKAKSSKKNNFEQLSKHKKQTDLIHKCLIYGVSSFVILALALIVFFIVFKAVEFLSDYNFWHFITGRSWNPDKDGSDSAQYGILLIILSTLFVLILALLFAVPLSIFTSLFVCEFLSKKLKTKVIGIIRLLAGIPSVVFGIFALTEVGPIFQKMGAPTNQNLLLASLILGFMALPIMISLSINAIDDVPNAQRYASMALGLSKTYTTFRVVARRSTNGIISAIIMGIARIIGETMAVIMIAGNSATGLHLHNGLAEFLFSSVRTLAGTIGLEILENHGSMHASALYAIGVILFACIIIINICVLATQSKKNKRIFTRRHTSKKTNLACANLSVKESRKLIWKKVADQKLSKTYDYVHLFFMISSTIITISFTLWVVFAVLIKGFVAFFVTSSDVASSVGINPVAILGLFLSTIILVITTMLFAIPLSLIVAIYLSEYSNGKSLFSKSVNFSLNIMASTPSILFGMFGLSIFIGLFHMPLSILTAGLTLTFLVIPMMINSIQNSLVNVPDERKHAALALGASKTESIWKISIPSAMRGIVTGTILSMARIVGESAPIYLTLGTVARLPGAGFLSPGTTLSVKIYMIFKEGSSAQALNIAYELALIVMATILFLNLISGRIANFLSPVHNNRSLIIRIKETFSKNNIRKILIFRNKTNKGKE